MEVMEEGAPDLRELVRLPDVLVVCSSNGWTDERHMLYLQLLEETFVHQLHESGCSFKGMFNRSPRRMKSSKQIVKCTTPDQGCAIVEGDKVKSCIKAEHVESPSCCGNQQDENVCSMEGNASTTDPVEEASSHATAASPGQASMCYVGKNKHSPSRSAGRGVSIGCPFANVVAYRSVVTPKREKTISKFCFFYEIILQKQSNSSISLNLLFIKKKTFFLAVCLILFQV